ncbi:MAG: family 78 glycoside hydrolase catalytic domain [Bacteroidales bacterium]|nr:family 78 glycoside hydrolase catalytic domain [Candidatus Cacconaster merdequi]
MKRLIFTLSALIAVISCAPVDPMVVDLKTNYMTNPVGIDDAHPSFSWRMESNRYGVAQQSYKVTVSSPEKVVFDSGTVRSDISVGIMYNGEPLEPCTRYRVDVEVWDSEGKTCGNSTFFETGLMGSGWDGAQWIGSKWPHFSKYRSKFTLGYTVNLPEGSRESDFIFGHQDSLNYMVASYVIEPEPAFILTRITEGKDTVEFTSTLKPEVADGSHRVELDVVALDYSKGFRTDVYFDGNKLNDARILSQPYPISVWKPYWRFNRIGFYQKENNPATYSDIKVTESAWNTTLYDSQAVYDEKGDGTMHLISPADETGAPMFRKSFEIKKEIKSARLYTTAKGIYEYYINGRRLANDFFNPGSTDYRVRYFYNTYDITPYLSDGRNAVCAQLGAGWYSDFTGFPTSWQDQYGTQLALLAKIVVTYKDGTSEVICSDGSWKVFDGGPITSDSFLNGEDYDARREVRGWSEASFDDSAWENAAIAEKPADTVRITSYTGSPVQNNMTLTAQSVSEPAPGVFVYDMGQNMVGVPSITLKGKEGQEITIRYGEMIYPEIIPEDPLPPLTKEDYIACKGLPYTENYRGALSTDHYICKGEGVETIQPHFTFHGYRYIALYGLDKALPLKDVKGLVLESIGAQTSGFNTSDANVNKLYSNIVWGQRCNFLSIPTDCPQRDERFGWTGDAQVFSRAATYNMNVAPFFHRWFYNLRDTQAENGSYCDFAPYVGDSPYGAKRGGGSLGWTEAAIIIPWHLYLQYGDTKVIEEQYASMSAYMAFLNNRAINFIQPGTGYGDWVALEHTNSPLTNTAYYAYDAMLMEKMAYAIGKQADGARYHALYENIKEAFNREFVGENGITKTTDNVPPYTEWIAGGSDGTFVANTQTSYALPLQADLFNEENKPLAVRNLVDNVAAHDYTLTTGFIGTPYITLVLSANGHNDVAYKLFEQTNYPSWLYPVLQGATTMWERWNSYTIKRGFGMVDMNSFNHYAFGAIEEWMMSYMLGIIPDESEPGYKHFKLAPCPGGTFEYVRGHFDSVYGRIESGWKKIDGGYEYSFTVPANTSADLTLDVPEGSQMHFSLGGEYVIETLGKVILPAGKYIVAVK